MHTQRLSRLATGAAMLLLVPGVVAAQQQAEQKPAVEKAVMEKKERTTFPGLNEPPRPQRLVFTFGMGTYSTAAQNPVPQNAFLQQLQVPNQFQSLFPSRLGMQGKEYSITGGYTRKQFRIGGELNIQVARRDAKNREFFEPDGNQIAGTGGYREEFDIQKAFGESLVKPLVVIRVEHSRQEIGNPFPWARKKDMNTSYANAVGAMIGRYDKSFLQAYAGFGAERMRVSRWENPDDDTSKSTVRTSNIYPALGLEGRMYSLHGHLELPFSITTRIPTDSHVSSGRLGLHTRTVFGLEPTYWVNVGSRLAIGFGGHYTTTLGRDEIALPVGDSAVHGPQVSSFHPHVRFKLQGK